jgi:hypothetical protein
MFVATVVGSWFVTTKGGGGTGADEQAHNTIDTKDKRAR